MANHPASNAIYSISVANSLGNGNRAPILTYHEYFSWVDRIQHYLAGHDEDIWTYIATGKHTPEFLSEIDTPVTEPVVSAATLRNI